ncbi:hypothetical protein BVH03_17860 [Pseudomonas sp. PA15(2017)]|uniref:hypothetical protein n=1 Tax=Pseudomonas sp. PA15(2017) TaxID=1932111 RepID=UPI000967C2C6|nr:hypothetical protein [Pseudomonas sp. PA15(2017)]OLU25515.1 hypothetical protein BVH03_17860 [Pseudomonas sp. PA15(2017)]
MKEWLKRRSTTAVFVSSTLLVLILTVLIQRIGVSVMGVTEFAQLVESSKAWLLPVRLILYAVAGHYWWGYCKQSIEQSSNPTLERRARNRMTAGILLYMAALEFACWMKNAEVTLP